MAARDIALMNAVYPDVPAVVLPVDGGGTARFTEVSDTTATASDVAQGKYFYTAAGVKTAGTASGSGSGGIVISDTTDAAGGTVRTITAVDLTNDTVTANSMLNGVTAHDNTGAAVTGNIASKSSSDLTANVLTVTAPAGYYESNATKTLSDANLVAGNIKNNVSIFGVTGTYEGGGGASNVVIGTFTGQASEKGTAKTITVPYTGNGYPLSISIYPTAGAYKSGTDIYTITQYKAIVLVFASKSDVSLTPDYTNSAIQNQFMVTGAFKGSSSNPNTYSSPSISKDYLMCYRYTAGGSGVSNAVRFYNSGTNLTVYIAPDGGTEYGFLAGTEYTYEIVYSS